VVIATDSEYVVGGATEKIICWEQQGWAPNNGNRVQNEDLWKLLLWKIRCLHGKGVNVSFRRIPTAWNRKAFQSAKRGATFDEKLTFTELEATGVWGQARSSDLPIRPRRAKF
jgi:ribonuclease HI